MEIEFNYERWAQLQRTAGCSRLFIEKVFCFQFSIASLLLTNMSFFVAPHHVMMRWKHHMRNRIVCQRDSNRNVLQSAPNTSMCSNDGVVSPSRMPIKQCMLNLWVFVAWCKSRITASIEPYFSAHQHNNDNDRRMISRNFLPSQLITIVKLQFSFGENPMSAIDGKIAL